MIIESPPGQPLNRSRKQVSEWLEAAGRYTLLTQQYDQNPKKTPASIPERLHPASSCDL